MFIFASRPAWLFGFWPCLASPFWGWSGPQLVRLSLSHEQKRTHTTLMHARMQAHAHHAHIRTHTRTPTRVHTHTHAHKHTHTQTLTHTLKHTQVRHCTPAAAVHLRPAAQDPIRGPALQPAPHHAVPGAGCDAAQAGSPAAVSFVGGAAAAAGSAAAGSARQQQHDAGAKHV